MLCAWLPLRSRRCGLALCGREETEDVARSGESERGASAEGEAEAVEGGDKTSVITGAREPAGRLFLIVYVVYARSFTLRTSA